MVINCGQLKHIHSQEKLGQVYSISIQVKNLQADCVQQKLSTP